MKKFTKLGLLVVVGATSAFADAHLSDTSFSIEDIVVVAGALFIGLAVFWAIKKGLVLAGHNEYTNIDDSLNIDEIKSKFEELENEGLTIIFEGSKEKNKDRLEEIYSELDEMRMQYPDLFPESNNEDDFLNRLSESEDDLKYELFDKFQELEHEAIGIQVEQDLSDSSIRNRFEEVISEIDEMKSEYPELFGEDGEYYNIY